MAELNSSSRLKAKRDTFFLPDQQGGVYFRNNVSSFRMEGKTIHQWIEKLLPMFNGEQTLEALTEGLTPPYRNRVYEIGETLYKNGFVRDVSKDIPHQLNRQILEKYASQIEFIENFSESGAYHFQVYRQAKVLIVGSGQLLASLVAALLESGLPKFTVMVTDTVPTNRLRLDELVEHARKTDSDVEMVEVPYHKGAGKKFWKEAVNHYDWILYVSQEGNVNELRNLNQVCKEENKAFLPAIYLEKVGLSGPLTHPESEGCFESAWRRIHQSFVQPDEQSHGFSSTSGAILANVSAFEFFKRATRIADANQSNQIYLLNLDTMEGDWLSFITHPFVTSKSYACELIEDLDERLKQESDRDEQQGLLLEYFSRLTSKEIGIFHTWEERNLPQLPLSQCYVQTVDSVSEGPAELQPEVVCSGMTHEEARRNAGLKGIEMYVSKMVDSDNFRVKNQTAGTGVNVTEEFIGIGSGETTAEAVCRGLQAFLDKELKSRAGNQTVYRVPIGAIEDKKCRFYLKALTTLKGSPAIGLKEDVLGFPVVCVRSNGLWYTGVGLNNTLALQNTLQQALFDAQNQINFVERQEKNSMRYLEKKDTKLIIPSCEEMTQLELLQSSIQVLNRYNKQLYVYDLSIEPFLKQVLAGVYGVQVREGAFQ
ncbi:putative thiazole-containing bacteriocin maturation protein [Neobacillus vireti]|uniref:Group-specific protein n=1 Tax=Neobacillus vireti LMG 21834 TaxID=1131730 RepID=A0AB94II57_9BACI|nr:putative thiazole-containing bacteriocin maturation protein [Neobacillus vireti]ETI66726.1 group-specific protein [Neobacillus vireti LMG 21834]KLT15831.1 bacteriocin maturation protein [Neobacillus vireti]